MLSLEYICPQEYDITPEEKLEIGLLTSLPLLMEIVTDLEEVQASESAKGFFYFTKERAGRGVTCVDVRDVAKQLRMCIYQTSMPNCQQDISRCGAEGDLLLLQPCFSSRGSWFRTPRLPS
jgi:hypothetical protein